MGHTSVLGYVLWAIAQNLVIRICEPQRRIVDQSKRSQKLYIKACHILYRNNEAKNCPSINTALLSAKLSMLEISPNLKKVILRSWPLHRIRFEFMYLGRLDYGSEAQMRSSDDQNQR
jgi:hypothetical protein